MTESYTLEELISGYFDKEFSDVAEVSLPKFSLKHRIAMRRIFREFADNVYKKASTDNVVYVPSKPRNFRKRLIIVAIIIIGMAILTGFVIMFFSDGFKGTVYHDNTHLFAVNTEGCPTTIEKEYELSVLPEGYELSKSTLGHTFSEKIYCGEDNQELTFIQYVKTGFNPHINTEGYELVDITVNGYNAVYIDFNNSNITILWDSSDYILEISGGLNKNRMLELATMNENAGF